MPVRVLTRLVVQTWVCVCVRDRGIDQFPVFIFITSFLFVFTRSFINTVKVKEMIDNLQTGSLCQILLRPRSCLIRVCQ